MPVTQNAVVPQERRNMLESTPNGIIDKSKYIPVFVYAVFTKHSFGVPNAGSLHIRIVID